MLTPESFLILAVFQDFFALLYSVFVKLFLRSHYNSKIFPYQSK